MSGTDSQADIVERKGCSWRFSLRRLLVIGVIGSLLGWFAYDGLRQIKRDGETKGAIARLGGQVRYSTTADWQRTPAPAGDPWNPRSDKSRYDFDCPVLADGYEIALCGAAISDKDLAAAGVKNLSPLRTLNLQNSRVSDAGLRVLAELTELVALDLDLTNIGDPGLEHLRRLSQLRWLSLHRTKVSDAGLKNLSGLGQLQWLDLGETGITGADLGCLSGLKRLEVLRLGKTEVTDAAIEPLKGFTQLKELWLDDTKITAEGKVKLLRGLPKCKIIWSLVTRGGEIAARLEESTHSIHDNPSD